MDLVGAIMDHESGNLSTRGELELFAHLIKTGQAWSLQGHYGRAAQGLIDSGLISPKGEVDWDEVDYRLEEFGGEGEPDWDARNDDARLEREGLL